MGKAIWDDFCGVQRGRASHPQPHSGSAAFGFGFRSSHSDSVPQPSAVIRVCKDDLEIQRLSLESMTPVS